MSGCYAGVQFIKKKSPQAVYVHCCAHQLSSVLVVDGMTIWCQKVFSIKFPCLQEHFGLREIVHDFFKQKEICIKLEDERKNLMLL